MLTFDPNFLFFLFVEETHYFITLAWQLVEWLMIDSLRLGYIMYLTYGHHSHEYGRSFECTARLWTDRWPDCVLRYSHWSQAAGAEKSVSE